jgi:autotransporter-associated beta strand protein
MTRTSYFSAPLFVAILSSGSAYGQLDPNAFPSLGTLNVSSGTLTINTDTLAMSGAASFTGVSFNQNNGPQVAVFDFSSITIGSGVTVTLTGSRRALALLSQGNATIQPTLTVSTFTGNDIPTLGGYAGGFVLATIDSNFVYLAQNGGGPGGGGATADQSTASVGGGGHGGPGGFGGSGGLPGSAYGNLFQTLQGGGGGGAAVLAHSSSGTVSPTAEAGAGGGALEVVAAGTLTVASVTAGGSSASAFSNGNNTTNFGLAQAGGGAGGGILLFGGTGLTLNGALDAHGGDAESAGAGAGGGAGGGGGGRIAVSGLSSYTLGTNPFSFNLNGGNGTGGGTAGFAGVLTVDTLSTAIPSGTSVTLNGTPVTSVAGSTTQTGATVEAFIRNDLVVNSGATVTLGMNNALQHLDASGNNITSLTVNGTLNLNGFSQTVNTFQSTTSGGIVTIPAGSTLSVGVNNSSSTYTGQLSGPGSFVKIGSGVLNLSAPSPNFTGQTTVTSGQLVVGDLTLQNSTVVASQSGFVFGLGFASGDVNPVFGALAGTTDFDLVGRNLNSLTVGGNNASTTYAGDFIAGSLPGGLIKAGTGVWTLTGGNSLSGPFNIQGGTVLVASGGVLSPNAPTTLSAGATLDLNGYGYTVTPANPLTVQGTLRLGGAGVTVASGATATYNGGFISNGFLSGSGTQTVTGGATLSGVTTANSATLSVTGAASFTNLSNSGALTVAAGLAATPTVLSYVINQGSGSVTVGANSPLNVSDFQTYGTLTINPATVTENFSQTTLMTNTGTSQLYFNGGSRTFVGTPSTAVFPSTWPDASLRGTPTFVAGIDLHGQNAVVAGGLFVNNGYVEDSTNNFQGTATVVADFGSLVKGAGFFQNTVITQNGGKFQPGNSPGSASFGKFVFGPGGVASYVFAIDDATGTAGPSPDVAGQVRGWGLVKAVSRGAGPTPTTGDFTWTATPTDKLLVSLQTLVNPTTVGVDVPGMMDYFDPNRSYIWPAVEWTGAYAGPADDATLDEATTFDTSGFANPIGGRFGWSLDTGKNSLSLTYTPSAVPEPGTLALGGLAALGLAARRLRCKALKLSRTSKLDAQENPRNTGQGKTSTSSAHGARPAGCRLRAPR